MMKIIFKWCLWVVGGGVTVYFLLVIVLCVGFFYRMHQDPNPIFRGDDAWDYHLCERLALPEPANRSTFHLRLHRSMCDEAATFCFTADESWVVSFLEPSSRCKPEEFQSLTQRDEMANDLLAMGLDAMSDTSICFKGHRLTIDKRHHVDYNLAFDSICNRVVLYVFWYRA